MSHATYRMNSRGIKNLNVKGKTTPLIKENIEGYLYNLEVEKDFYI